MQTSGPRGLNPDRLPYGGGSLTAIAIEGIASSLKEQSRVATKFSQNSSAEKRLVPLMFSTTDYSIVNRRFVLNSGINLTLVVF